jgi:hypothetical protein
MTRVLVVHHDLDLAGQEVESLRRFGYEVTECGGPSRNSCPVLAGEPCAMAERADVLVYDAWASGTADGARQLIENIRDLHPRSAVVLTHNGPELSWEETTGPHAVTPLLGQPTGARLHEAIQAALGSKPVGERHDVPDETLESRHAAWPEDVLTRLASS